MISIQVDVQLRKLEVSMFMKYNISMLCYVMLCYVMLCYVMLCYVMLCYVMLCYVMLCYVMLCYVMLCYVMLYYSEENFPDEMKMREYICAGHNCQMAATELLAWKLQNC